MLKTVTRNKVQITLELQIEDLKIIIFDGTRRTQEQREIYYYHIIEKKKLYAVTNTKFYSNKSGDYF